MTGSLIMKKSPHEDLFCIPEIKSDDNCLVKNYSLIVYEDPDSDTRFFTDSEMEYRLTSDTKIVPVLQKKSWGVNTGG